MAGSAHSLSPAAPHPFAGRLYAVIVLLLFACFVFQLWFHAVRTSVTVDEPAHILAGHRHWQCGDCNYKDLVDTSAEEYDEMMDSNVRSTFLFTRHAVPVMIGQRGGLVLMISSMAGVYGFPGEAVYCATKFAQVGFAEALDKELRPHGIKVGAICPGGVKTEFAVGKGRTQEGVEQSDMLEAEDVARAVVFACTQPPGSRIIQVQMRTMAEALT